jgi:hypothetical protein
MSAHTPGPWAIDHEGNVIVEGDGRATIAWVSSPDSFENGDEPMMANARLIAEAPNMLMTLKDIAADADAGRLVYDDHELRPLLEKLRDEARAAIAKAEGTS